MVLALCDIAHGKEEIGLDELTKLEAWCEAHVELMQYSLEKKFVSKYSKERIKNQIIGIDKVLAKIKQMKLEHQGRENT